MNKPQRNAPSLKNHSAIFVALIAACLLYMAAAASAAVISVNFTAGAGSALGSGETAGFVPDDHWNNSPGTISDTMTNLLDGEGQTVTGGFQVSYANAKGVWRNTSSDPANANASLFNGQLFQHPSQKTTTVTLTNVPYAQYNLYIYLTGPASDGRKLSVSITGQPTYYVEVTLNGGFDYTTGGSFVRSTNTTGTSIPQANYVLYEGLSAEDLSFAVTEVAGNPGLAGFQIVQVPEPATLALLGAGLLIALRRRSA